jgi:hypothetical protein
MPKGLPKPERLSETLSLKLSRSQVKRLREAAAAAGARFGTWARDTLVLNADVILGMGVRDKTSRNGRLTAPEVPRK